MLTKAIIVELSKDMYRAKIRIPKYDKAKGVSGSVPDSDLLYASICTPPGIYPYYQPNDIVYVLFEDDVIYNPVIIGSLYCKDKMLSNSEIIADTLTVTNSANLTENTTVNQITVDSIINDMSNLKNKLRILEERVEGIE